MGLFSAPRVLFKFVLFQVCLGNIYTAPDQIPNTNYDFIVIGGAGTAGSVVAARLSENPAVTISVIEAGLSDNGTDSDVLRVPFLAGQAAGTIYDWNYTTTEQAGLNGRTIDLPRGFVIGGSSNINNMVYIRGPSEDFDRIGTTSGDSGWSWLNLQKYIFMNERHVPPWNDRCNIGEFNPAVHGNGPLQTSLTATPSELDQRVIKTTIELQDMFPFNLDFNSGNGLGVGWIQSTVGHAARSSSSTAFLDPALNSRNNLDLLLLTHVTRLLPVGSSGVDFRQVEVSQGENAPTSIFTASKEVILSAGAIGTPQILQLSGIGPKEVLQVAGVKQLVDLPDVGGNLRDQTIFFLQWEANAPTLNSFLNDPTAIGAALAQYASNHTGIAASSVIFNTIAFLRLPDGSPLLKDGDPAAGPNSAHFQFSFLDAFLPNPGQTGPSDGDWISVSVVVQSPTSKGNVNIVSNSAFVHPTINPAYYTTAFDIGTTVQAVKALRTFFSTSTWDEFLGKPFTDAADLSTDAAIESYARRFATTLKHPVGTARISKKNESSGVVGPDLIVKKITGVRVVDASVLPFAPEGFPQAQVYILAERAAELIKERWSSTCDLH